MGGPEKKTAGALQYINPETIYRIVPGYRKRGRSGRISPCTAGAPQLSAWRSRRCYIPYICRKSFFKLEEKTCWCAKNGSPGMCANVRGPKQMSGWHVRGMCAGMRGRRIRESNECARNKNVMKKMCATLSTAEMKCARMCAGMRCPGNANVRGCARMCAAARGFKDSGLYIYIYI